MTNGKIGWVEMYTKDGNKLADFYESVFGWKIQKDPNMPEYVMFTDSSGDVAGGFAQQQKKANGGMYLLTDDIDEHLKTIEKAGGKTVTKKTEITDAIGWWAQFEDPDGNVMGLFQQTKR
jgi:predicted enzyme related to lactoylglutathione lyase